MAKRPRREPSATARIKGADQVPAAPVKRPTKISSASPAAGTGNKPGGQAKRPTSAPRKVAQTSPVPPQGAHNERAAARSVSGSQKLRRKAEELREEGQPILARSAELHAGKPTEAP